MYKQQDKYNDTAFALTWELLNNTPDIGEWELTSDQGTKLNGKGFKSFFESSDKLSEKINVVFVKNINWFFQIVKRYIETVDNYFVSSVKNGYNIFYMKVNDNLELRNWDNFWSKVDNAEEFLDNLTKCRDNFKKHDVKNRLSLGSHYKRTLAAEMWEQMKDQFFLNTTDMRAICKTCSFEEDNLYFFQFSNKAGFYYLNPKYRNKVVGNVHCYDISSDYIGMMSRKHYPYGSFKKEENIEEIQRIIKDKRYCWFGVFAFSELAYINEENEFFLDLQKYGEAITGEGRSNCWALNLTNVDMEYFKRICKWDECAVQDFWYCECKLLDDDIIAMVDYLYRCKNAQPKGSFAKTIHKFRAELPCGQSIKGVEYNTEVIYDEESKRFDIVETEDKTYEEIKKTFDNRGLSPWIGIFTIAYGRLELYNMMEKIGFNRVVYADTDSVKFIGDEGKRIIIEHNKEIDKEVENVRKKRGVILHEKLGKWLDEGDVKMFKAINPKWYATMDFFGNFDVKAAGADPQAIKKALSQLNWDNPVREFSWRMVVPKMFIRPTVNKNGTMTLKYISKFDSVARDEMKVKYTRLYQFKYGEEVK